MYSPLGHTQGTEQAQVWPTEEYHGAFSLCVAKGERDRSPHGPSEIGNAGMGCCLTAARSQGEGVMKGSGQAGAAAGVAFTLLGPSQGCCLTLKDHILHVLSVPGGGAASCREGSLPPALCSPLRSWASSSGGSGWSRLTVSTDGKVKQWVGPAFS